MARTNIRRTQCTDCPAHISVASWDAPPIGGIRLVPGQRYCTGGKKPKQFRPKDPKLYPPSWCPKLKKPADFRIYAYKDAQTRMLQHMLRSDGIPVSPSGYNCAVRNAGHTSLTARSFWEDIEDTSPSKLLGVPVHTDEVVEIDDGIKPRFFHICEDCVKILPFFDAERARQNKYDDTEE